VEHVNNNISIINAGSANISHPTQGLLDLLTIRQYKGSFENLVVAIVGDIKHSRVARSAIEGLSTLGVGELRLIAPKEMTFESKNTPNIKIFHNLDEGIKNSDVIMSLRIQKERISNLKNVPNIDEYIKHYRINQKRIMTASPEVIIMHPGPVNRDIEIESSIVDGPHSVITKQVTNGVAVRMAILSTMIKN
jgi:aspartate carbamoyltransferase catalytic subunit